MHKKTIPTIETEKLILRGLKESDAKSLFEVLSNSKAMKYWDTIPHESMLTTSKAIINMNLSWLNDKGISWGIVLKEKNNLIGQFSLHSWNESKENTQIGYIINPKYWGKSLGSEALSSVISFSFNDMCFKSILAEVDPNNKASIAILEKHDFILVEKKKKNLNLNNKYYDTNVYELIKRNA